MTVTGGEVITISNLANPANAVGPITPLTDYPVGSFTGAAWIGSNSMTLTVAAAGLNQGNQYEAQFPLTNCATVPTAGTIPIISSSSSIIGLQPMTVPGAEANAPNEDVVGGGERLCFVLCLC